MENYLTPAFGRLCLREVTPLAVQRYFSNLATSKLSHESRDKIRDVLSSMLGSANWRCLRTSHATWRKMAGADVKDAQSQLRHSKASTTLDTYQQFVPESQRWAVDLLSTLSARVQ